jgi:hypothetical protein
VAGLWGLKMSAPMTVSTWVFTVSAKVENKFIRNGQYSVK